MATERIDQLLSRLAASDLSALQFTFVVIDGSGNIEKNTVAGGWAVGVLQNKPIAGQIASVATSGITKIKAGATITADDKIMSTNAGAADVAVAAAPPGNFARGQALEGGASGEIITMLLEPTGYLTT